MSDAPAQQSVSGARRLHALDAARAFAIVLVVAGHALPPFMHTPIGWAIRDQSRHLAADLMVWICHAFLMPVFFLIAGFFARLTIDKIGPWGFARQRLQRVLVPLVVFLVPCSMSMNAMWDWGKGLTQDARAAVPDQLPELRPSELPVTLAHLWYLYYLLIVSAAAIALVLLARRAPVRWQVHGQAHVRRAVGSVWLPVLMALPTTLILQAAGKLQLDTPLTFAMDGWIAGFHGLFFLVGWMFHAHSELLASQARHAWVYLVLALVCLLLLIPVLTRSAAPDAPAQPSLLALGGSAVFTWLMSLGFIALCIRYVTEPQPWIRFIAGASYWCYVTHLPLVVLLQIGAWHLRWPGLIEYAGIVACTMAACLLTYRALVQNTALGRFLG